jgi:flagellar biosynthesis chaperone FliJ
MTREPLETVARLRHSVCEDARRALAACLEAEDAAHKALRNAGEAIFREQDAASALDAGDGAVEAFAAWLPLGRRAVAQAREAHLRAGAATVQARAVLAAARASAEAADRLLASRAAERDAEAARRAQAALDEAAARQARPR